MIYFSILDYLGTSNILRSTRYLYIITINIKYLIKAIKILLIVNKTTVIPKYSGT